MDNGQLPTTRNASPAVSRKRSRRLSQGARFALVAAKASRVLAVFLTFDYLTSVRRFRSFAVGGFDAPAEREGPSFLIYATFFTASEHWFAVDLC
mmetsp:Transcript_38696/g.152780  ORF Transcript_38696/g.152780 Transcript_38696/m.152780 type:complete len:95 (-) Transcript_38696:5296-5580(-)